MNKWLSMMGLIVAVSACKKEAAIADHPMVPSTETVDGTLPELVSGEISGRLELADGVKEKVAAGDVIFVMARNAVTGSLIAVTRVDAPAQFPVPFTLTGDNIMHARTALAGKVKLEARVDKDRDAISKNAGDVIGELADLVSVPAHDVVLRLDRVL